jgi:hypothetical protein
MRRRIGLPCAQPTSTTACRQIGQMWYGKAASRLLAERMYADGGPCLLRKKERISA